MYNNDYIIAVDENGFPYIAHRVDAGGANGSGQSTRRTKFIAKFPNLYRMGKTAYAYTQEQAEAMQRYAQGLGRKAKTGAKKAWGSKAGRWIDEHDAGITERIMANRLSRKAKKASKKGYHDDAMAYSKRSSELRKESRDERSAAKEAVRRHGKATLESIKGAGRKARDTFDKYDGGVSEGIRYLKAKRKGVNSTEDLQNYQKSQYDWRRSKLGQLTTRKKKKTEVSNTSRDSSDQTSSNSATDASIAKQVTLIRANPKIGKSSNVSDEYLIEVAFNGGASASTASKFNKAKDALSQAQRDYNRVSKLSSSSGEVRAEKSDAQKALKQAQREYNSLRQDLIDSINEYDAEKRIKELTR